MVRNRRRFYDGLKPVHMPLAEFLNTPPAIHVQDLEKQIAEQIRKEQSAEIRNDFRSLVKKAVYHDNEKKLDVLAIQAMELKMSREEAVLREQDARQKKIADEFVAKKFREEIINKALKKPSVTTTRQTLFGKSKHDTREHASRNTYGQSLERQISNIGEPKNGWEKEELERLKPELERVVSAKRWL